MPFLQFRSLHLGVYTIVLLLTCGVFTTSLQQINKTASPGETVILHCNQNLTGGFKDVGWRKDGNLLFNYSPVLNQTVINYTSNRMQVDPQNPRKLQISDVHISDAGLYKCFPLNLQWRLNINVFTTSLQQINKTASPGETVILHCNQNLTGGFKDVGWRKDGNLLFNYSPVLNQTVINYTSNRMQVDPQNPRKLQISDVHISDAGLYKCFPLNLQWRLNINETQLGRKRLFILVFSVTTACVAVCLFLFCAVCLHRKCKKTETFDNRDTMDEPQSHRGRVNRNQASQYFERFNSVYGQIQI
ncbi:uncharacterized protein LOC124380650 [Silurus meridionalis]|uniref:uncharacterized protein LOC124380650 n=1 Tax=Silurus meridionalis TaxID=175797 RepID=UPI001EEC5D79|nr:uncharacterized protein LOC124380650 [Silurus meridionalis]